MDGWMDGGGNWEFDYVRCGFVLSMLYMYW